MPQPIVKIENQTLIIEWDNRSVRKSTILWMILVAFWLIWTPLTIYATHIFSVSEDSSLLIWLIPAYMAVVLIPLTWLGRYSVERVELSPSTYSHYFVRYPWLFPKHWPTAKITRIQLGQVDDESIKTLNVYRGWRRDLLGYWAAHEFRRELYCLIRDHVDRMDLSNEIEFTDKL